MDKMTLPLDQIIQGDSLQVMESLPAHSIDLVFADPPYNLQLQQELWRPNMTRVQGVTEAWDQFQSFQEYDQFTRRWLSACRRLLKNTGALWVIGTYHNIYRIGAILQELGYWILNNIVWIKVNPMPNFRGVRFTNAHETLIWASKSKGARYTFNHHAMKAMNDGLQMRSDWLLPICAGAERLKVNGKKAHSTQKPEALLYRLLLASTNCGDIVLDPFFGTGTTGAVAKKLHRHWIGIEKEPEYVQIARQRIDQIEPQPFESRLFDARDRRHTIQRIPFSSLLENGLLLPGQPLYFQGDFNKVAHLKSDGHLVLDGIEGSIHQIASHLAGGSPCSGWVHWYYETPTGDLRPIDELRKLLREE